MSDDEIAETAARLLAALDAADQVAPLTDTTPDLPLADAYRISGRIADLRRARGERIAGWKIGFTNRTIWDEYGVHAPIWGPVYDGTLKAAGTAESPAAFDAARLPEPRIEPEIAFRLSAAPRPGMDEADLLACVGAIGHSFEIVQSVFPGWRFRPADTAAAFALHGRLFVGPLMDTADQPAQAWLDSLARFTITLRRDGEAIDRGEAQNVLDGPLSALKHFVDAFDAAPFGRGLEPGDLVTTGTLTRAFPLAPGQTWTTEIDGLPIAGIGLRTG